MEKQSQDKKLKFKNIIETLYEPIEKTYMDNAISNLIDILKYFESKEKDVILRFAYDTKGKALEEEPFSFKTVLEHAKWIVESLQNNSRNVFIVQGLILGNWGEMHTSKHISDENLRRIYAFLTILTKIFILLSENRFNGDCLILIFQKPMT